MVVPHAALTELLEDFVMGYSFADHDTIMNLFNIYYSGQSTINSLYNLFVRFAHSRLLVAGTNITSRRRRLPQHFQPGLAFGPGNDDRTTAITPEVDTATHHVENSVVRNGRPA